MQTDFDDLIGQVVLSARLPETASDEIRRELESHCFEKSHSLQLQGKQDSEIKEIIQQSFGDPAMVGNELHQVHRKYEKIPIIGPLMYFRPFIWGLILAVMSLLAWFVVPSVFSLFISPQGGIPDAFLVAFVLVPELLMIGQGVGLAAGKLNLRDSIKAVVFASFLIAIFCLGIISDQKAIQLVSQPINRHVFYTGLLGNSLVMMFVIAINFGLILLSRMLAGRYIFRQVDQTEGNKFTFRILLSSAGLLLFAVLLTCSVIAYRYVANGWNPLKTNAVLSDITWQGEEPIFLLQTVFPLTNRPSPDQITSRLVRADGTVLKTGQFDMVRDRNSAGIYLVQQQSKNVLLEQLDGAKIIELGDLPTTNSIVGIVASSASQQKLLLSTFDGIHGASHDAWFVYDITTQKWSQDVLHDVPLTKTGTTSVVWSKTPGQLLIGITTTDGDADNPVINKYLYDLDSAKLVARNEQTCQLFDCRPLGYKEIQTLPAVNNSMNYSIYDGFYQDVIASRFAIPTSGTTLMAWLASPYQLAGGIQAFYDSAMGQQWGVGDYGSFYFQDDFWNVHNLQQSSNGQVRTILKWMSSPGYYPSVLSLDKQKRLVIADHGKAVIVDLASGKTAKLADLPDRMVVNITWINQ